MKKSVLLITFLLAGFFVFGQNVRPYVIKYQTQNDTVYQRTQSVSGIHIDAEGQEMIHENGTDWASLTDLDTVYVYRSTGVVSPNYVPIDWDEATLLSADDSLGNYQIQFDGDIPDLQTGSIITIDQDTVVHHLFVVEVTLDGNIVEVTSTEAYLTDIFADTDFTLTTMEEGKSSAQGNVFYPVAIYQLQDDGVYRPLDLNAARGDGWGFTHDLWQFGSNFDGEELFSGDHYSVYMERMNFDFDLDLEMYMNFSGRDVHEIVGNAIDRYRSRTLNVNASLHGVFNTEQMIRCDVENSFNVNPAPVLWKSDIFRPLRVKFLVYGVPVVITLSSDLCRQVQLTGSGQISAYTGFNDTADGRLGFEWQQGEGISPVSSFSNTFEFIPPTLEGRGSIQGKAWVFPRVKLLLYDAIGPTFDFKPYLSVTVSGGFKEELLGQANDFCAWSLDVNTGLDLAAGLSLEFVGFELFHVDTPNWNVVNRLLYHSPKRIHRASVGSGLPRTVHFTVFDQNYIFNTEVITPLPQFVKFEATGQLSSEYGIANNGQVSVNWTPAGNDILYAKLYDVDGNVMSWDSIHASYSVPTVTTSSVTNITQTSATCGGNVTGDGGATVTVRGICWGTSHNPTASGSHATSGTGLGSFTASMTGLTANTTYYVRAYATNTAGTAYGNEVSFTTGQAVTAPTVTTSSVTNITQTSAMCGGNVTSDGGATVSVRGICWGTSHNPTASGSHATSGTGTGSFTASMTGLTANTTYYVRAYATNTAGTAYGNEVSFTTGQAVTAPTVTTSSVTNITQTSATCGGNVTSDGGATVTVRGICWGTSHNPTASGSHTTSGMGTGSFTASITGLTANTTYYVRAYATNTAGTAYGNEVSFTTMAGGGGTASEGAIDGLFSVSETQQVYFSQGNLQYKASTNTWQFAENQYDYIGGDNSNISSTFSGWIDLFCWGTSGWNSGANCYQPWSTSTSYSDYYPGGSYTNDLTGSYANADWGVYNAISNGGNQAGLWRTLTMDEWVYVLNTRSTASGMRFAKACVNNVNGLILLPDDWSSSYYSLGSTNTTDASFSSNTITLSQWDTLEQHGAVFLPAAGERHGASVDFVGSSGEYWSASYGSSISAYYVSFNNINLNTYSGGRYYGKSVRLVCPAE